MTYVTEEQRSRAGCIDDPTMVEILTGGTRRDEGAPRAVEAGWVVGPSDEYSTYSTDEQRRQRAKDQARWLQNAAVEALVALDR